MENATKALLIAAAVLVAVLIISLGIMVYTKSAQAVEGQIDLSAYQIQQFNEKFTKYAGENESGSNVNALIETVFAHNNSQQDANTCVKVTVDNNDVVAKSNSITSTPARQNVGARYTVECTLNSSSKLVDTITITTN